MGGDGNRKADRRGKAELHRHNAATGMIRVAHRLSALVICIFLVLHVANHMVAVVGQAEHIRFMQGIRPVYRNAVVEPVLLMLFAWQALSGLRLLSVRWRNRDGIVAWLQIGSGAYLVAFLLIHVPSVLVARYGLGTETDFGFAAAGLHSPATAWFFAPYYAGSLTAMCAHIGCASSWALFPDSRVARRRWIMLVTAPGLIAGVLIVLSLGGVFYEVQLHG